MPVEFAQFDEVASPCEGICLLSYHSMYEICIGCGRTTEEIVDWQGYNSKRKAEVRLLAENRKKQLENG